MKESEIQDHRSLQNVRILDFSWVIAGPLATKTLAEHGATVIRVESNSRLDIFRSYTPMAGGIPGVNRCGFFNTQNSNKYGITLNLNLPGGIDIVKRLVSWADVVIENYMPGTMEKWGLGYRELQAIKPDIIMARATTHGQTGPLAGQGGFGFMLQAECGFTNLVGWPDRAPAGPTTAYTDTIAAAYLVTAVLASLEYRRRTGEGLLVDLSQFEASLSCLAPAILDFTVNGRVQNANGNRSPVAAPHGVYRCRGDDRWCAIAACSDDEWHALCQVLGMTGCAKDPRFASLLARKEHEDELDEMISALTVNWKAEELMLRLQQAGVPAGIVQNGQDLAEDPQFRHREVLRVIEHPEAGPYTDIRSPFKLSETRGDLDRPAPCLGQHNEYVCRNILGMSDEEFVELISSGVLE